MNPMDRNIVLDSNQVTVVLSIMHVVWLHTLLLCYYSFQCNVHSTGELPLKTN